MKEEQKIQFDYDRCELGIDGSHAFALLGADIQEGEAEFVQIAKTATEAYHAPLGDKLSACDSKDQTSVTILGKATRTEATKTNTLKYYEPIF